jgi:hypothetical protein
VPGVGLTLAVVIALEIGAATPATSANERIAWRKGHPDIGAVARHLAEATYWLLSEQEAYREPHASAVSSTGDKREFAMSFRKLEFDCDIPRDTNHATPTAKIWLRRNGLMRRQGASPARIDSGRAGVRLVNDALRVGATTHERKGVPLPGYPPETDGGAVDDHLTTQRFALSDMANDKEPAVSGPEEALACYFSGRTDGLR